MSDAAAPSELDSVARNHLRVGWWSLLVFLSLGLVVELFHGFKLGLYLDLSNSTRRLMWTLAHAHGTLLSLILIGFASTSRFLPRWSGSSLLLASRCLKGATLLMPLGFFLGGIGTHGGDPGLGVILVATGGLLLLVGVLLTARRLGGDDVTGRS